MWDLLLAPFMIRAIIAAAVTGLAAPGDRHLPRPAPAVADG